MPERMADGVAALETDRRTPTILRFALAAADVLERNQPGCGSLALVWMPRAERPGSPSSLTPSPPVALKAKFTLKVSRTELVA